MTNASLPNQIMRVSIPGYDAIPAARSTRLKTIIERSALHCFWAEKHDSEPTSAMQLGTATHCAILEPERFAAKYVTFPGKQRRGEAWEIWRARHPGIEAITASERQDIEGMTASVRMDPLCQALLAQGEAEVAMVWTDPSTGVRCKARVDWLDETVPESPILVGLKTTRNSAGEAFQRQSASLMYHLQWAMYSEGYWHCRGIRPRMVEIAVENCPPYAPVVYEIGQQVIEAGERIYHEALATYAHCLQTQVWPGFGNGCAVELKLPRWAPGVTREEDFEVMAFAGLGGAE